MLGFERKEPFVVKGEYAKKLRELLWRMHTGNYNQEDLEHMHDEQTSPDWEIIDGDDPDGISNFCRVCDLHRNGVCEGKRHSCESYMNVYDSETCKFCKHAQSIEGDNIHIKCPIKNEIKNIKRWCVKFEKNLKNENS